MNPTTLKRTVAKTCLLLAVALLSASSLAQSTNASSYVLPKYMHGDISSVEIDLLIEPGSSKEDLPFDVGNILGDRGIISAAAPFYWMSEGSLIIYVYVFENQRTLRRHFADKKSQLTEGGFQLTSLSGIGNDAYFYEPESTLGYIDFHYGNVEITITSFATVDLEDFARIYAKWLTKVHKPAD